MSEKVMLADIQAVFNTCGIEWVDQNGAHLSALVEQLSDGLFVGYYLDESDTWVDSDRLGETLDEAIARAREICEVPAIAAQKTDGGIEKAGAE